MESFKVMTLWDLETQAKSKLPKYLTKAYQSQNLFVNRGNFRGFIKVGVF